PSARAPARRSSRASAFTPAASEEHMDTGDALLQAIRAEPEDDSLRLICADWLQDHGDPDRAEFIRLEIALDRPPFDGPEKEALEQRRDELLRRHEAEWFGVLKQLTEDYTIERGFVEMVSTSARCFAEKADVLFAAAPLAWEVLLGRL